jgi:protease-4
MGKKGHPLITVLVILGVVALFLGTTMVVILKLFGPSAGLHFGQKVGVVLVEGPILDSEDTISQLIKFKKDNGIKAIILRIDSPGGAVGPSQEIYQEVRRTTESKKVVASMGGVAASGGYYIAAAADKIVANPGTITGSIGVIMEFIRAEEFLSKIGISLEVLKSGEFKDIGSPHRKLTDRDRELINSVIADIQKQFVEAVATGRNISMAKIQEIADGRIFSGLQAKELGLVDVMGNFQDAVELTKKMVGIEGDVALIYPKKEKLNLWDLFFEAAENSIARLIHRNKGRLEYRWNGLLDRPIKESY